MIASTPIRSIARAQNRCIRTVLIGILVALSAMACSRSSDEEQLRNAVLAMQAAMEAAEPGEFMEYVSDDFTGAEGTADRTRLHNLLRAQVLANSKIGVSLGPVDVEVQGERATVAVTVALSGGNARWLPERAGAYRIVSGWRRESGQWRCINAQWERTL